MKNIFFLLILSVSINSVAQNQNIIHTDIDNFWATYDQLEKCKTKADSIQLFQTEYLDKASEGFASFADYSDCTAQGYYSLVKEKPKFYKSIKVNTLKIKEMTDDIEQVYVAYEEVFPDHIQPKICFSIGCLNSGGTVDNGYLLIGADIMATDSTTDKSELGPWLNAVMTNELDIKGIVAHEYVHALQKSGMNAIWAYINHQVLFISLQEGSADFLAEKIAGTTINKNVFEYGHTNEQQIWEDFKKDIYSNRARNWVYQGDNAKKGQPADLGYFVGYKICEAYYNKAKDKQKALKEILEMRKYKQFYKKSGYDGPVKN